MVLGGSVMYTKAPLESPDHATANGAPRRTLAVLCALLAVLGVSGTPDAGAQGAPCTSIENDAERLACYDRALRR